MSLDKTIHFVISSCAQVFGDMPLKLFEILSRNYNLRFQHTRLKARSISAVGLLGFPTFYVIWGYLIKQPYENLGLRLIGVGFSSINWLCGGESKYNRLLELLSYISIIYCIPFFFTFMLLMNGVNAIWLGSAVCGILYSILLMDAINLVTVHIIGSILGIACFLVTTEDPSALPAYAAALPVLLFALMGGFVFDYHEALIQAQNQARTEATKLIGGSIAHEMRTPLLGIRFDAEGIQEALVDLNLPEPSREEIRDALVRISQQTSFANVIINMLLMNIDNRSIDKGGFSSHSMSRVVYEALEAYPFRAHERPWIAWDPTRDFVFLGSSLLMRHVLFNLLKNALRAVAEAGHGTIEIRLVPDDASNHLYLRDTGTGIPADRLPRIFEPFYTSAQEGTRAGIGLAFCHRVITGFNGTILCRSEYGKYTEFDIVLPKIRNANEHD